MKSFAEVSFHLFSFSPALQAEWESRAQCFIDLLNRVHVTCYFMVKMNSLLSSEILFGPCSRCVAPSEILFGPCSGAWPRRRFFLVHAAVRGLVGDSFWSMQQVRGLVGDSFWLTQLVHTHPIIRIILCAIRKNRCRGHGHYLQLRHRFWNRNYMRVERNMLLVCLTNNGLSLWILSTCLCHSNP